MDFQFFSFVTLTTLGYGDLVPGTEVGQSLSMVEAVLGQVFLVTVVAMAVGNLGATLPHRRQS
ncbi:MAG: potassium channel family protein [Microthrixaceae bacterium]